MISKSVPSPTICSPASPKITLLFESTLMCWPVIDNCPPGSISNAPTDVIVSPSISKSPAMVVKDATPFPMVTSTSVSTEPPVKTKPSSNPPSWLATCSDNFPDSWSSITTSISVFICANVWTAGVPETEPSL